MQANVTSEMGADEGPVRDGLRYAVVFKTYIWDDFVERQARRCEESASTGTFYVLVDETGGPLGPIPFARVIRTSNAELTTRGYAPRFERGSLLWWNADYPHYHFHDVCPDYDFYVFIEYDALYVGHFDHLIREIAKQGIDLAAFPLPEPKASWCWTQPHLRVYPMESLEGCLICISVISNRALGALSKRRLAMSCDESIAFWPSAEVFLATECKLLGFHVASLEAYGDASGFNWRPPRLEEKVIQRSGPAFFHPVYDRRRYIQWALEQGSTRQLFDVRGPVLKALVQLPVSAYAPALVAKFAKWARAALAGCTRPRNRRRWTVAADEGTS